jgi:hypothetical protein
VFLQFNLDAAREFAQAVLRFCDRAEHPEVTPG